MDKIISKYFEGIDSKNFISYLSTPGNESDFPQRLYLLCLIAGAQADGNSDIMRGLIKWGVDTELTIPEIYEILLQGHLFLGYPKALESFFILNEICENLNLPNPARNGNIEDWNQEIFKERGFKTARKIYARNFELVYSNIQKLTPELALGMISEGYGRIISRPNVDLIARELAVVSVLTVTFMPRQLYSHIRGAYNTGASVDLIKSAVGLCRAYRDDKLIDRALLILEKSLGKFAHPE